MVEAEIGELAGAIWHLLAEKGRLSVRKIGEITYGRESRIYLALGWLAREGKIVFTDEGDRLYVELKG